MTTTTITGRLTGDPELRFIANGAAVANFTIAHNDRIFDKAANEWKDGPPLFMRCSVWREQAENVAESLTKGAAVLAIGKLVQREWETREGEKRTVIELAVDHIGPDLRWSTAKVSKAGGRAIAAAPDAHDPWANEGAASDVAPF